MAVTTRLAASGFHPNPPNSGDRKFRSKVAPTATSNMHAVILAASMHPRLPVFYQDKGRNLVEVLNTEETRDEATAMIRGFIDRIVLHPRAERGGIDIGLHGQLAAILAFSQDKKASQESVLMMVAEEGLEPPTRGL